MPPPFRPTIFLGLRIQSIIDWLRLAAGGREDDGSGLDPISETDLLIERLEQGGLIGIRVGQAISQAGTASDAEANRSKGIFLQP